MHPASGPPAPPTTNVPAIVADGDSNHTGQGSVRPTDPGERQESRLSFVSPPRPKVEARGLTEQAQGTYPSSLLTPAVTPVTSPLLGVRSDGGSTGSDSVVLIKEPNKINKGMRQAFEEVQARAKYAFVN